MKQIFKPLIKGMIDYKVIKDDLVIEQKKKCNGLVANFINILRHTLAENNYQINVVQAYKAGVLLAEVAVGAIEYTLTSDVTFKVSFSEISFDDTLDELRLGNTTLGTFSQVTGLSITKDGDSQLKLNWTLTILNTL